MLVSTIRLLILAISLVVLFSSLNVLSLSAKAWLANDLLQFAWTKANQGAREPKPWPWADIWPIGEIEVERLKARQLVLSADHGNALAFGAGIHPHSAPLGQPGVSLVGGHRDTHFRFLKDLRVKDRINVRTVAKSLTYEVQELLIVDADSTEIANSADSSILVLSTCYPFNDLEVGNDRFLVIAESISESAVL